MKLTFLTENEIDISNKKIFLTENKHFQQKIKLKFPAKKEIDILDLRIWY